MATVSRYINRTGPVAEETAARLQQVMQELNYVPHTIARNLATNRNHAVGLLLTPNFYSDFFSPLLSGIESVTSENRLNLLISSNNSESDSSPGLGPHNTDGLLVYANSLSLPWLKCFHDINFPVVLIHQTPPPELKIPFVSIENKAATRKIIEHLIKVHNHRRIVFLRGSQNEEDSVWREIGYKAALEATGIPYDPRLVQSGAFERDIARAAILDLISAGVEFDAVFAGDDDAAVGVYKALQEAGKCIPEDIAVTGFDDQRMSSYLIPPLTTVRAPTGEVGSMAALQLINLLQHRPFEPVTILPTEVIIRRSCGCEFNH